MKVNAITILLCASLLQAQTPHQLPPQHKPENHFHIVGAKLGLDTGVLTWTSLDHTPDHVLVPATDESWRIDMLDSVMRHTDSIKRFDRSEAFNLLNLFNLLRVTASNFTASNCSKGPVTFVEWDPGNATMRFFSDTTLLLTLETFKGTCNVSGAIFEASETDESVRTLFTISSAIIRYCGESILWWYYAPVPSVREPVGERRA